MRHTNVLILSTSVHHDPTVRHPSKSPHLGLQGNNDGAETSDRVYTVVVVIYGGKNHCCTIQSSLHNAIRGPVE